MSIDEFSRVISEFAPLSPQIYLHILGEPLLHPQLDKLLDIARAYGLYVNITTNGTLIEDRAELLLSHPAVRKVSISVHCQEGIFDSGSEQYINSVVRFGKEAAEGGRLYINYRMWTGGDDFLSQSDKEIVRYLISSFGGVDESSYQTGYNSYRLSDRVYICYDRQFDWPNGEGEQLSVRGRCLGGREMLGVLADGTVVPCCLDSEGRINLGNIFRDSRCDIMNNDRYLRLTEGFSGGIISEDMCRKCAYRLRFDRRRDK